MSSTSDLTFVHLSDIHFRRGRVDSAHDPDRQLRDALVVDLRRLVPQFGQVSGVIITGDIAFGGHRSEYKFAESWIQSIVGHLRCSLSDVMVTPGNHDVNRESLGKNGGAIAAMQSRIRRGGNAAVTVERLARELSGTNGKRLMEPIRAYNKFATRFGCDITPSRPFWEREFKLGDGTMVVIRGITSTWLSGPRDSDATPRLLYGSAQYGFGTDAGTHVVVAGHHPPAQMIDGGDAEKAFDFYCRLQLFGHKHDLWLTDSKKGVKIVAGALHPDRREKPWIPRYNVIELSGELVENSRFLKLRVHPRRWSEEFREFMADFTPQAVPYRGFEFPVR